MPDLHALCNHLRELGNQPETLEARAEVEAAFAMKWEGIQIIAAEILGKWGGTRSRELLRDWVIKQVRRGDKSIGANKAANKAMLACHVPEDVEWIWSLFFTPPQRLYYFSLPVILPIELVKDRILAESCHRDVRHRAATLEAIAYRPDFPDKCSEFTRIATDDNKQIQQAAKAWLRIQCEQS